MKKANPYWIPKSDPATFRFYVGRMKFDDFLDASETPEVHLPFFSFLYLVEGEVLVEIAEKSYLCQSGQMLMIPRNVPFSVRHFKDCSGYEGGFSINVLKDVSHACLHSLQPLFQTFTNEEAAFTAALLEQMIRAFQKKDCTLLASALDLLICRMEMPADISGHATVNRFLESVFNRSRTIRKVSEYADEFNITPNYLNRLVRNHTGHSAIEWIEISRITLAKSLLREGNLPISEVATAIGINDNSYFTRFFKKTEGVTPTQYRERKRKEKK